MKNHLSEDQSALMHNLRNTLPERVAWKGKALRIVKARRRRKERRAS